MRALPAPHGAGQSERMPFTRLIRAGFAVLVLASPAAAQPAETPYPQALALREAARAAAAAGEWDAASRFTQDALALQPGHPGLLRNSVLIAESAGGDVFAALEALAAAGGVFDLAGLETRDALAAQDAERLAALETAFASNAAPTGEARPHLQASDLAGALVESLALDIETERVFLGLVSPREIRMLEPFSEGESQIIARAEDGLWSVFGMAVDRTHRLLYATTGVTAQTPLAEGEAPGTALVAYDLVTFEEVGRWSPEGAIRLADLVTRDGQVFVSDAESGTIYRLDGPRGRLEPFFTDTRFASLQGIALSRGAVFVADYALGVWRIDPGRRTAERLVSDAQSLIGLDGLAAGPDGRLYAVRNGMNPPAVLAITPARSGESPVEPVLRAHPAFETGEPTLIRIADGRAFLLANSAWPIWGDQPEPPETPLPAPVVLSWRIQ